MPRSSFTWLFSFLLLATAACGAYAEARPTFCLPPIFEGGQRLHELPAPSVGWLEPLLRQHEVCWRSPARPDELRIFLYGNSAVFGFPLPVGETIGQLLNQHFVRAGIPAHVFNLAFVATSEIKDALIIHESLKYQADVIVYAMTLDDLNTENPKIFARLRTKMAGASVMAQLVEANGPALVRFAAEHTAGLSDPVEMYASFSDSSVHHPFASDLRQVGALVRTAVRIQAQRVRSYLFGETSAPTVSTRGRQTSYDCAETKRLLAFNYNHWKEWNILAYLQQIQQTTGVTILIVNWPAAHEPVDDCYNVRYSNAALEDYDRWLREETRARGLRYADLHTLLAANEFFDSVHVTVAGQQKIANWVALSLDPILRERAKGAPPPESSVAAAQRVP